MRLGNLAKRRKSEFLVAPYQYAKNESENIKNGSSKRTQGGHDF
jgi:hypothetical protein